MKIFSTDQIREGDSFTIAHEPVCGLDLMERAGLACADWITCHGSREQPCEVFCGSGRNGADGLVTARILLQRGFRVRVHLVQTGREISPECRTNWERLQAAFHESCFRIRQETELPALPSQTLILDALFGTGLNRIPQGLAAACIHFLNGQGKPILSIDLPSGLYADRSSLGHEVVRSSVTLSLENFKLAFLLPENESLVGKLQILPIGWDPRYAEMTPSSMELSDLTMVRNLYRPRSPFSHKGSFGHALLVCGSYGKMGAAVLASLGCLRSGAGLLTISVPESGYAILQSSVPEALCRVLKPGSLSREIWGEIDRYQSAGIGPGLGTEVASMDILRRLLELFKLPMVLDADALNLLARNKELWGWVPPGSILTPHPREFQRLFGKTNNDFERLDLLRSMAREYQVHIVLKGHYSCLALPDGHMVFNPTGNPGMATGGSGDVLTGILTGLLAQGYGPRQAAILGLYLHGLAGELAMEGESEESLIAGDLPRYLGKAFRWIAPLPASF